MFIQCIWIGCVISCKGKAIVFAALQSVKGSGSRCSKTTWKHMVELKWTIQPLFFFFLQKSQNISFKWIFHLICPFLLFPVAVTALLLHMWGLWCAVVSLRGLLFLSVHGWIQCSDTEPTRGGTLKLPRLQFRHEDFLTSVSYGQLKITKWTVRLYVKPVTSQPQRFNPRRWRQKNLCMDNREDTSLWNTSSPASCILYLLVCVLCIKDIMTFQWLLFSSHSTVHRCMSSQSHGESVAQHLMLLMDLTLGGKQNKPLVHFDTNTVAQPVQRMHTDSRSYAAALRYIAVYMYSIFTMYSHRSCTLHVEA